MGKKGVDVPYSLIETPRYRLKLAGKLQTTADQHATEMAIVHNSLLRGLNTIYLQAPNIKELKDVDDFLTYVNTWNVAVHKHHEDEETLVFPLIEKEVGVDGLMEENVIQHKAFSEGLNAFWDYIKAVQAKELPYVGQKVIQLIDNFGPTLREHLTDEINTLLALNQYNIDWKTVNKAIITHAIKTADKEKQIPFMMCSNDTTFEGGLHNDMWPPLPWLPMQLFRYWYFPKHKGAWRFGYSNSSGRPQELQFA